MDRQSVDLVYLDPPFNSKASYNLLFRSPKGGDVQAQTTAFKDTWTWNSAAELAFDEVLTSGSSVAPMFKAFRSFLGEGDMMAYLSMMAPRLIELHRVLKLTGSLYLHCDSTASHYLKLLLDGIFGPDSFRNEIIWKRTSAHSSARRCGPVHDVIFFYSKTNSYTWNNIYQEYDNDYLTNRFKRGGDKLWKDADLTGSGIRHGETGLAWRGFNPTLKGRHWAYPPSRLDEMDAEGSIYWPKKVGGWPREKVMLADSKGVPLQDLWSDIPPIKQAGWGLGAFWVCVP
jgi:site-specific DNA-methyltransferase (adenine-specific)